MSRDGFLKRVYAVAFTDAVHRTPSNKDHRIFFGKVSLKVADSLPLLYPDSWRIGQVREVTVGFV